MCARALPKFNTKLAYDYYKKIKKIKYFYILSIIFIYMYRVNNIYILLGKKLITELYINSYIIDKSVGQPAQYVSHI